MAPGIYLISPPEKPFVKELKSMVKGTDLVYFQYRRPGLSDRERYEELREVRDCLEDHSIPLIVNDRPDLAKSVDADGVHLGAEDLPVNTVKEAWPELIVGRTLRAEDSPVDGADYYGVGPVFSSFSKTVDHEPVGWDGIRTFLETTSKDVFAIGGIEPDRLGGFPEDLAGVCVIGAVWDQPDPVNALEELGRGLRATT